MIILFNQECVHDPSLPILAKAIRSVYLSTMPIVIHTVLNIGSASQLSVIKPEAENLQCPLPPSVMEVPYFDGNTLLTAASLTGGNIVATFVKMLQSWMAALGVADIPDQSAIYAKLVSLACERVNDSRELDIGVTLWGERHEPGAMGAVLNITPNNLDLGGVGRAMLRGVVNNLRRMMPQEVFQQLKVTCIIYAYALSLSLSVLHPPPPPSLTPSLPLFILLCTSLSDNPIAW